MFWHRQRMGPRMKPEDITGINSQGWRVHVDGCTCDYNERTSREWVPGADHSTLKVVVEQLVSRVDPKCTVHHG